MATQAERIEALETELERIGKVANVLVGKVDDLEKLLKDGETLDELRDLVAKAAALLDFETLKESVADLWTAVQTPAIEGELITITGTEPGDLRHEVLKAFWQIEAVANHINVKLPA